MLTWKQDRKYWREWAEACRTQGWTTKAEQEKNRKAWHARLQLPESHKDWSGRPHFNKWIAATAHLRNVVDIRDRDRESVVWTIDRLRAGFILLLGHDYAKTIMADWRDTEDLDNFPISDPLEFERDSKGQRDPRDKDKLRDLENLRNTLKNRLGRVIQRLRDGDLQPGPNCPKFGDSSQADIIASIISAKPAKKTRKYTLDSPKNFQQGDQSQPAPQRPKAPRRPAKTAKKPAPVPSPASSNRKYCTHPTPPPSQPPTPHPHHADPEPF